MLAFWGYDDTPVESVSAEGLGIAVPRDLRLRLDRASETLGMGFPGVDEVLKRDDSGSEPL